MTTLRSIAEEAGAEALSRSKILRTSSQEQTAAMLDAIVTSDKFKERLHEAVADAIYADTWTEPKPTDPNPDWHRRFARWQSECAADLAVAAILNDLSADQ